ncbi:ArsR/SmtB family transcription factor [Schlesneria paludicola]|uniref:ArsR/SmtB family transcription factor n=1 Tax=Schlesneria paludicola TaxID=360056 RepID=UPI00029A3B74|nr:metalloregulator ArsR/SmtB family transcription factor [Schlesneria paludicola]
MDLSTTEHHFDIIGNMEESQAIRALSALAHEYRLRIFRLLAKHGTDGMAAGKIAEQLELPAATLSFHVKELLHAGLIVDRRESRSIIYSLNPSVMRCLLDFLLDDCCSGHPELCTASCKPTKKSTR